MVTAILEIASSLLGIVGKIYENQPNFIQSLAVRKFELEGKINSYKNMATDDSRFDADDFLNLVDEIRAFTKTLEKFIEDNKK